MGTIAKSAPVKYVLILLFFWCLSYFRVESSKVEDTTSDILYSIRMVQVIQIFFF